MPNDLTVVTPAAEEPTDVTELKRYLNIQHSDEDQDLEFFLKAGREEMEKATGLQLIQATYDWKIDNFSDPIELPLPPLVSVTSVKYFDNADVEQTVSSAVYVVDTDRVPGRIRLAVNQSWPSDFRGGTKDITIRFVTGYANSASVPAELKAAIWMIAGQHYRIQAPGEIDRQLAQPWALRAIKWRYKARY